MKKIKIKKKLSLNKQVVTKLNADELSNINGAGGLWSIGVRCTQPAGGCRRLELTDGIFCNDDIIVL